MSVMKIKVIADYGNYKKISFELVNKDEKIIDVYTGLKKKYKTEKITLKSC